MPTAGQHTMTFRQETDPKEMGILKSTLNFPVVGIGASAVGIAALQRLLEAMPAEPGMSLVVVMDLSPDHESTLPAILQKFSPMPVMAVMQTTRITVNHVYVISPAL